MDNMNEQAIIVGDELITPQEYERRQTQEVERLHQAFAKMRDTWVHHRAQSGVESRWRRNMALYLGEKEENISEFEKTLREGPTVKKQNEVNRSRVVINIVRPKVDQAVARMCEILFPVDDRNWGIRPTPRPELAERVGNKTPTVDPQTGQPTGVTADDEVKVLMEEAKKRSEAMERTIDDSLTECDFNSESRKIVQDGVMLGTGILKGPFPAKERSKIWIPSPDGTAMMQFQEKVVPASARRDPWDIFFDPACGNNHQRGRGVFERRMVTRKELRALVGLPGYDPEAIKKVLREEPRRVRIAEGRVMKEPCQEDAYELWEYHGEVEPEDMLTLSERSGDPLEDVTFGMLIIVNDCVIGTMPSWCDDGMLPYDVWCWRKSDDLPFGYGLPDELEHQQRVINSAWRMVMDNGRVALGGQIVMKRGVITPANGQSEITPMKLWYAKDDVEDIRQAFGVFDFNSHLNELLAVAKAAMEFADMESSMPQILGGNQAGSGGTPETVGGMVMLFNNATAVLRQRVKLYDDCVTRQHIARYYDWHMANNPDPAIKGDFEVDARGSTALIERDIQNQALLNLANITNNPRYIPHLKEREELKAILKAFKVNPEELLKPEDQVQQEAEAAAQQGQPQDPRIMAAEMNMQAKQLELQDRQAQRDFEMQRNQAELGLKRESLAYNSQREQAEFEIAMTDAAMQRDMALMKLGQDAQLTREQVAAKERLEQLKIANEREIFNAEAALRVNTGAGI